MANPEHLKILNKGVEAWNSWKEEHPDTPADLSQADLSRKDLFGVNFFFTNLSGSNLAESNLAGAGFMGAKLHQANLKGAILTRTYFRDTDFSEADLTGADLTGTHAEETFHPSGVRLMGVIFTGAKLFGAKLREANLRRVSFMYADLREADFTASDLGESDFKHADLSNAKLNKTNLIAADLRFATLKKADFTEADLSFVNLGADPQLIYRTSFSDLEDAILYRACLDYANLFGAKLSSANLRDTSLVQTNLNGADLSGADLSNADLRNASLLDTVIEQTILTGCRIYGISVWNLKGKPRNQTDLLITPDSEADITVDNLEVAQFIYLLLNNEKIRQVIDTITSKVVLILGRFTPERKAILDTLRDELRSHDFLPVLFDFQRPDSRDFTETVSTLAHMSRFVIADMTEARIVLEEVPHIVRNIAVPLIPLLLEGEEEPVTLYNLRRNHRSVLPTYRYTNKDDLLESFDEKVIAPAIAKAKELSEIK